MSKMYLCLQWAGYLKKLNSNFGRWLAFAIAAMGREEPVVTCYYGAVIVDQRIGTTFLSLFSWITDTDRLPVAAS